MSDNNLAQYFLIAVIIYVVSLATAIPIDNAVLGTSVQCAADAIGVNFTTKNPFNGRIFVQGMSERPECTRNYADGGPTVPAPIITFTFGECNMQRTRTLSPQAGMLQTIVVVISFHRVFITKVDRAYKIQCFYMESEKTVTSQLEVSMMTTEVLHQSFQMPTCAYVVRRTSRTGEVVRYAKIGDTVFHEWECDSDQVKILVKSCVADDGQGNKQLILDDKGCAIDPVILSDLTYEPTGNARASVETHVFKYADKPTVFFQCTVQICTKGDAQCEAISPPKCIYHTGPAHRSPNPTSLPLPPAYATRPAVRKREANFSPYKASTHKKIEFNEIDLLTDPIAVLDLEDTATASKLQQELGNSHWHKGISGNNDRNQGPNFSNDTYSSVCVSTTGFAFLVGIVLVLFVSTTISAVFICLGKATCSHRDTKM